MVRLLSIDRHCGAYQERTPLAEAIYAAEAHTALARGRIGAGITQAPGGYLSVG